MFIPKEKYESILSVIPILCVDLLIRNADKILLLKRDNEPAKGEYWFPGGRVLKLETIKSAALRKAKEEVSLDCKFHDIISIEETIFKNNNKISKEIHTVNIVCKLTATNIEGIWLDDLHSSFLWVSFHDIFDMKLHPAVLNPIKKELNNIDRKYNY